MQYQDFLYAIFWTFVARSWLLSSFRFSTMCALSMELVRILFFLSFCEGKCCPIQIRRRGFEMHGQNKQQPAKMLFFFIIP